MLGTTTTILPVVNYYNTPPWRLLRTQRCTRQGFAVAGRQIGEGLVFNRVEEVGLGSDIGQKIGTSHRTGPRQSAPSSAVLGEIRPILEDCGEPEDQTFGRDDF